jgi:hypothetical protein
LASPDPPPLAAEAASSNAPPARAAGGVIDEKARRLAEFFNGEVLPLEEALPGLSDAGETAA